MVKWLVDVTYNYGIQLRRCLPFRCLKIFLFPFFAPAIYKIICERNTTFSGFYICGTSEPIKNFLFFMNVSKVPAASVIFSTAPLRFVDQARINVYFSYGPPLFPSYDSEDGFLRHLFLRTH
jgi:hypothetical protein